MFHLDRPWEIDFHANVSSSIDQIDLVLQMVKISAHRIDQDITPPECFFEGFDIRVVDLKVFDLSRTRIRGMSWEIVYRFYSFRRY